MTKYNFLMEFLGFFDKENTITSVQFNNIIKLTVIKYLQDCIKLMFKYNGEVDVEEDDWFELCDNNINKYVKLCSLELKKNGLNTFKYSKLYNDIADVFHDYLKYSLNVIGNNWVITGKKGLMKTISKLNNPKHQIFDNNTIIREYKLKS